MISVVMYHYVRPMSASRYRLNALDVETFERQLVRFKERFHCISIAECMEGAAEGVLLTFDDGYLDHYQYVLPLLLKYGLKGAFFAPAVSVLERRMLDVNKIHFILALNADRSKLIGRIEARVGAGFRSQHHKPNRYDDADTSYIKTLLQTAIPSSVRSEIVDQLFREFVTTDEASFADELYVSVAHLREMEAAGMHVGGHGHTHVRLSTLSDAELEGELAGTTALLSQCHQFDRIQSFCFPYGDYDARVVHRLRSFGFQLSFTTKPEAFDPAVHDRLEIPRLDTNDFKHSTH